MYDKNSFFILPPTVGQKFLKKFSITLKKIGETRKKEILFKI